MVSQLLIIFIVFWYPFVGLVTECVKLSSFVKFVISSCSGFPRMTILHPLSALVMIRLLIFQFECMSCMVSYS